MAKNATVNPWKEIDRLALIGSILAVGLLIYGYFGLSEVTTAPGTLSATAKAFGLQIIANLVPVFILLSGSFLLFRRLQRARAENDMEQLANKVYSELGEMVAPSAGIGERFRIWETRPARDRQGGFESAVRAANKELLTGSLNFHTTVERLDLLRKKAEKGCVVKFVTLKPRLGAKQEFNPVIAATARTIGVKPRNLVQEIEGNLELIRAEGLKLAKSKRSNWQVRVHENIGSIFLCVDGADNDGTIYMSLYPYGISSTSLWPLMAIRRGFMTGRLYRVLWDSYNQMFNEAEEWPLEGGVR